MSYNVLVTGGAGFVGSHLVDKLLSEGHDVTVLDNYDPQAHPKGQKEYEAEGAVYISEDVRCLDSEPDFIKPFDVIFHLAAVVGVGQSMYQPRHYASVNVGGTASLLQALVDVDHDVKKVVVASSMSIYGEGKYECPLCGPQDGMVRSESQLKKHEWEPSCPVCGSAMRPWPTNEDKKLSPTSVYATTKRDQEEMCLSIGKAYNIPTVALRFFNIYGPRQCLSNPYTGICAIFSSSIKSGESPIVFEDGLQTRDFVSVHDIVQANMLAMDNSQMDYQAFNVGTGKASSVMDVAVTLAALYRIDVKPRVVGSYRPGDIRHCYADISKIKRVGYKPSVDIVDGFYELVEWGKHTDCVNHADDAKALLEAKGLLH